MLEAYVLSVCVGGYFLAQTNKGTVLFWHISISSVLIIMLSDRTSLAFGKMEDSMQWYR